MLLYWALYYVGNVLCFWVHPTINLIYMLMLGIYTLHYLRQRRRNIHQNHIKLYICEEWRFCGSFMGVQITYTQFFLFPFNARRYDHFFSACSKSIIGYSEYYATHTAIQQSFSEYEQRNGVERVKTEQRANVDNYLFFMCINAYVCGQSTCYYYKRNKRKPYRQCVLKCDNIRLWR